MNSPMATAPMPPVPPALEIIDVSRIHGRGDAAVHALRGLHLTVAPGEMVAVMGPSGSGKSTLLNVAGGLDQATAGRVRVHGHELGSLSKGELAQVRRRMVGYVFQDYNLIPSLTAAENVALPLELDKVRTRVKPGQIVIQRGTSHGWEAIGGPALLLAVLIDRPLKGASH